MTYFAGRFSIQRILAVGFSVGLSMLSTAHAQTAPPLGQAGPFAVLAGSTVTNTGPSVISGEVGVSPGSAITGFPPGVVVGGSLHFTDAQSTQAQADVVAAYNALAGQTPTSILTGQDLGGLTLVEGVYAFSSSAQLTGTLTLDAQGNNDAVFVFQIGSTLTTASAATVSIINGGSNCRVFWQIGSSATLGTGTSFIGNILALTSITLNTNAMNVGRLLARNGAVVLDTNTASVCAECLPLTVTPSTLPIATLGTPYSQTLVASGGSGSYTFVVTAGTLPAGLSIGVNTGEISGTPSVLGTSSITVRVTDSSGCEVLVDILITVIDVGCPLVSLSPASVPAFTVGVPYTAILSASGGTAPYAFSVVSGVLPPGIALSMTGGASATLMGTPTTSGNYAFVISATDALGCGTGISYTASVSGLAIALPSTGIVSLILLACLLIAATLRKSRKRLDSF